MPLPLLGSRRSGTHLSGSRRRAASGVAAAAVATALLTVVAGLTVGSASASPDAPSLRPAATATALPHHRVSLRVAVNPRSSGATVVAMGKASIRHVAGHRAFLQRWDRGHQRWLTLGSTTVRANYHYRVRGQLARSSYVRVHLRGYGRAGDSSRVRVTVSPPTPAPRFSHLSVEDTVCVIKPADASLRCWGYNDYGSVGDGTTNQHADAFVIPGAWRSVHTSGYATCGIKIDGTLWCWGYNGDGAVGDGTATDRHTPVQVGTDDDWTQVQAGYDVSCGLRAGGAAYCWGTSNYGELGNGTTGGASSFTPTAVAGGHTFRKLAVDWYNVCGLTTAKALLCWGYGSYGSLGNGGTSDVDTPTAVSLTGVSGATTWADISLAGYDACATTTARVAYCWGYNYYGTAGVSSTTPVLEPTAVDVSGIGSPRWVSVATGYYATCGLTTSGTAYCWGDNSTAELGNGTTTSSTVPSAGSEVAGGHRWSDVTAGYSEACGISQDTVYCWGTNDYDSLGTGFSGSQSETPVAIDGL